MELSTPYHTDHTQDSLRETFDACPIGVYCLEGAGAVLGGACAATVGDVVAADIEDHRARTLSDGEWRETGSDRLRTLLRDAVAMNELEATTDLVSTAERSAVHVVTARTEFHADDEIDLPALRSTLRDVAAGLSPGDLLIVSALIPPNTCEDLVVPTIEEWSNVDVDDVGIAFALPPLRSGVEELRSTSGVVAGRDPASTQAIAVLWRAFTRKDVIAVSDIELVEWAGLVEATHDAMDRVFANQLARIGSDRGIDVRTILRLVNRRDLDLPDPGPGVGGVNAPGLLREFVGGRATPLLDGIARADERMPSSVADQVLAMIDALGCSFADSSVLLLGVAVDKDVPDTRRSPAVTVADVLTRYDVDVYAVDPIVERLPTCAATEVSMADLPTVDPDVVVLMTPHSEFTDLDWSIFGSGGVVDCHGVLTDDSVPQKLLDLAESP